MIPLLLIGNDPNLIEQFIDKFLNANNTSPAYTYKINRIDSAIKIEQIRQLNELNSRQDVQKYTVIIYDFETAKTETQNALLKKLEDDALAINYILVSATESIILPTILSRVKIIKIKGDQKNINSGNIDFIIDAKIKLPEKLLHTAKINKETALSYIDGLINYYRDNIFIKNSPKILKEIFRIRKLILYNNISPEYGLDYIIVEISYK